MHTRSLVPLVTLALLGPVAAQDQKPAPPKPATPPALAKALAKARVHNQRVLAVFAPDGDDVAARFKKDATLSRPLLYEFETVQFTGKEADALAVMWQHPDALHEKPALAVLDAGGAVLARLSRQEVVADGGLQGKALLDKLAPLHCKPVDAEQKLAEALALAKKDGRAVFVRFDAPW